MEAGFCRRRHVANRAPQTQWRGGSRCGAASVEAPTPGEMKLLKFGHPPNLYNGYGNGLVLGLNSAGMQLAIRLII